jgi:lipopolysaccharide heptosyltransferase II
VNYDFKKILVIRLSSLGDVLLTTPVLRALKQKFRMSEIHFLVRPQFAEAVRYNPNILIIHEYDPKKTDETKRFLEAERFDLIIDLQNNFRSRFITSGLKMTVLRFSKPTFKKWLLVNLKINLLKEMKNIPQRYSETVENLQLDSDGLDLFLPENLGSELKNDKNYIGLCPGAQHFTKRWPKEYFIELGNILIKNNYQVVLFGGKSDIEICSEISAGIGNCINLQNENELFKIAAGMKKCKLIISNDTGLMHVASAMNVPVISIFGSSVKEFGFIPCNVKSLVLENNAINCRPCSHVGKSVCPKKHFKCMNEINAPYVFDQIKSFIISV